MKVSLRLTVLFYKTGIVIEHLPYRAVVLNEVVSSECKAFSTLVFTTSVSIISHECVKHWTLFLKTLMTMDLLHSGLGVNCCSKFSIRITECSNRMGPFNSTSHLEELPLTSFTG